MNEANKLRVTTVAAVIALLAETFPKCFSVYQGRRRPLKLKIVDAGVILPRSAD
jgi:sRNA-binding protein